MKEEEASLASSRQKLSQRRRKDVLSRTSSSCSIINHRKRSGHIHWKERLSLTRAQGRRVLPEVFSFSPLL